MISAKARGLAWLRERAIPKFFVPSFQCLHILPPHICAENEFTWLDPCKLYAVRGGSTISLPGLLDTYLNVPQNKVAEIVDLVYASFDSPEVRKLIEHLPVKDRPIGSGVIVQQMVDADYYGVIFTASTNGFPDPTFRYANHPGEVVGEGGDLGVTDVPYFFSMLANEWYAEFGQPPEIEVAKIGNTYALLQIRNQKLTKLEKLALAEKTLRIPEGVKPKVNIPGAGLAIIENENEIIYLSTSDPIKVTENLDKKLIIWRQGSLYSHAAVLCRTHGIAYGRMPGMLPEPPFTFLAGNIYKPNPKLLTVPLNKKFEFETNWNLVECMISNKYHLPYKNKKQIAESFITALYHYKLYLFNPRKNGKYLLDFAQMLVVAAYIACMGEWRHENDGLCGYTDSLPREDVWAKVLVGYFQTEQAWLALAVGVFTNGKFKGDNFGGEKWAKIADSASTLLEYLVAYRKMPTFDLLNKIDRLVTIMEHMEHNGAVFWTKFVTNAPFRILDSFTAAETPQAFIDEMAIYMDIHPPVEPRKVKNAPNKTLNYPSDYHGSWQKASEPLPQIIIKEAPVKTYKKVPQLKEITNA